MGGRFAGRDLVSPSDFRVRPTAEVVRAQLLDALAADIGGARVLDLFAGTGALGLEALSRGASRVDFVEFRPASLHALKANVVALGVKRQTRIFKRDAVPFAEALATDSYEVAFADPPYGSKILDRVLAAWLQRRFARVLAVEHDPAHALPAGARRLAFPETAVTIYRL
ncbi:MAG TPA: RsmD family RNA methyltransferase [Gemmatimonadales bacterium]|nr:RsmD family RNA methyltransferase [Gemmatimonadales bacterium]